MSSIDGQAAGVNSDTYLMYGALGALGIMQLLFVVAIFLIPFALLYYLL